MEHEPRVVGLRRRGDAGARLVVRHSTAIELAVTGLAMARRAAGLEIGDTDAEIDALVDSLPASGRAAFAHPLLREDAAWTTLAVAFAGLPDAATAAEASALLAGLPPAELWQGVLAALACHTAASDPVGLAAACAAGDRRARAAVAALDDPDDERWRPARDELLRLSPSRAKAVLSRGVDAVRRVAFPAEREHEIAAILARSAASLAAEASATQGRAEAIARVIERATGGVSIDVGSFRGPIVLAPGLAMRPWNVSAGPDDAVIVYRVAADDLERRDDEPPPALVRLTRALGDERRLRLLHVLAGGPAGLGALSSAVGLAKSTVHHHLVLLRDAGLVAVRLGDDYEYELRREVLASLGGLLATYLGEATS
ncbi:MAG TPA: ArsR family transcriptional regulator [Acidimicrobiales bacterium]|nr:ArsR family transcriptional regulator [Acidimicrobiales bacterium]